MKRKFELIYVYKHCFKENRYVFGFAETEKEARQWVDDYNKGIKKMPRPEDEESRRCPVSYCPLKGQQAWFSYREVDE